MPYMGTWGHLLSKGMILLLSSLSLHMMNILPRVLQFVRFFRGSQGDRLSHFTLFLMQIRTLSLAMKFLVACMLTCDVVAYVFILPSADVGEHDIKLQFSKILLHGNILPRS